MDELIPVNVGDAVVFVDPVGKPHAALITAIHGKFYDTPLWTLEKVEAFYGTFTRPDYYTEEAWAERKQAMVGTVHTVPSVNVVYVSDDEAEHDPYGNQIKRSTSVCHRSAQAAHG